MTRVKVAEVATLQRHCSTKGPVSPQQECTDCREHRLGLETESGLPSGALAGRDLRGLGPTVQRSADHPPEAVPRQALDVLAEPGRPIDSGTRADLAARFGHDFASVRVHDGAEAGAAASAIGALAYTVGTDIVFGPEQYRPGTPDGRRLLAHELTHVLQQQTGRVPSAGRPVVGAADSPLEREADRVADTVTAGGTIQRAPADDEEPVFEIVDSEPRGTVLQRANGGTPTCPPYDGYSTVVPVTKYNCSGLAHRTYDNRGLAATTPLLAAGATIGCAARCPAGAVKHWLWQYDMAGELGGKIIPPSIRDFHTVAGAAGQGGADPTNVFSKNGFRPVYGPGTGPGFRPPAREPNTKNDPSEAQIFYNGIPTFKVRSNVSESCYCLSCPSQDAPLQGPPAP